MLVAAAVLVAGCAHAPRDRTAAVVRSDAPIEWAPWAKASFAQAAGENRLILVNVVATWCHWCHVMEDTTYEDPEVVALLRDHFVTIRVDSDARPDVAERYRDWGWPATGVLSPAAQPVLELRGYQQPRAFAKLLRELVADRDRGRLAHREAPAPKAAAGDVALDAIRERTAARLDRFYQPDGGAWATQQRYPAPGPIEHALIRARIDGDAASAKQATTTLTSALALVDPVFGGMYQYSTDGDWKHPHFEKITAIQAGAIRNYALAYRYDGDARWLGAAKDVARFMTTIMYEPERGFATSQDADLRVPGKPPVLGAQYYAKDNAGRRALGIPRIDDNVYADLNGMMIEALCDLYAASGEREAIDIAVATAQRIMQTHGTKTGAFRHGAADTGLMYLRDQIAMGRAMLALARTPIARVPSCSRRCRTTPADSSRTPPIPTRSACSRCAASRSRRTARPRASSPRCIATSTATVARRRRTSLRPSGRCEVSAIRRPSRPRARLSATTCSGCARSRWRRST